MNPGGPELAYSIIIPAHNEAACLGGLLASIPRRDDVEVIVADDHSEPEQAAAMRRLLLEAGFPQAAYVRNTGPQGAGPARNAGLDAARGRWLVFADADDIFTEAFADALDRYAQSDNDHVVFQPRTAPNPGGLDRIPWVEEVFASGNVMAAGLALHSVWSRFIRRDLATRHGPRFVSVPLGEEVMFAVRTMAMASAPVLDPATIYLTTPRSGSFLNSPKTMAQILSASEILAEKADYLRQHVTDETVLALALPAQSRYLKLALHWHGPAGMVRVAMTFAGHGVPLTHHPPRAAIALALRAVATSIFGRRGFNLYEAKGGRADRPIRVMLQLRSCTNPYVGLLQGSTGPGVEVRWFSFKQALLGDFDVFHMHFPVYWASGRRPGRRMMGGLALRLVFWLRGDRVVYTVHDLEPHLPLSPLRQWLFGLWAGGNARVYLTEWSKAAAHDPDGVVIKHGSYRELFAGCPLPAKAAEPRLVHFGALRWYRGTEDLLDAFGQLPPDSDVSLHILGRPVHGSTVAASVAQCARQPRLKADLRLVSDEELWEGVGAATLAVLPYRWITNSGPAIFAVSAGTPVLMPDSELARELQSEFGAYWIRTYEPPLTGARLAAEVQDVFLHQSCETLPPMDGWDWAGHIGPQYAEVYRTVAGAPRSRRWGYPRTDSQDPRRGS